MQHEAQARAFWRENRLLEVTLAARGDVVHLRPHVRHGESADVASGLKLWLELYADKTAASCGSCTKRKQVS